MRTGCDGLGSEPQTATSVPVEFLPDCHHPGSRIYRTAVARDWEAGAIFTVVGLDREGVRSVLKFKLVN